MIFICNFHVLHHSLLIYICKFPMCVSLLHGVAKDLPMMPADGGNLLLILLMKFLYFKLLSTDLHM
jgi:hypothetical protein